MSMIKMVTTFFSLKSSIKQQGSGAGSVVTNYCSAPMGNLSMDFFGSGRTILLFNGRPVFQWFRCINAYSVNFLQVPGFGIIYIIQRFPLVAHGFGSALVLVADPDPALKVDSVLDPGLFQRKNFYIYIEEFLIFRRSLAVLQNVYLLHFFHFWALSSDVYIHLSAEYKLPILPLQTRLITFKQK